MTKKNGAYIVMIAGVLLLIFNVSQQDFNNLSSGPLSGIIAIILLIAAMIVSINDLNKRNNQ